MLAGFQKNVSHQEIERILGEVEAWWGTTNQVDPPLEWLPLDGISNFMFNDLGYEDVDEFEDALQGSFHEFLGAFPHIETKEMEGRWWYKMTKVEPEPPRNLIISIETSAQLLDTTLLKADGATLEVPSIEFVIGLEQKRSIDSLWNHLGNAKEKLEHHADYLVQDQSEKEGIMATVSMLSKLLDVETPYDIIVRDPQGLSDVMPKDKCRIEPLEDVNGAASSSAAAASSSAAAA
eukprot:TRINITY_DN9693_c0_g1_i1.p1 TRINITY_DN9693_c0_g1~~TRINITY_DN9693_c0_g1_i1.p1  ORF type:complete len:235 (-),score=57.54 TRINITY_DN9693_c0_g1_i1:341-1045(-)